MKSHEKQIGINSLWLLIGHIFWKMLQNRSFLEKKVADLCSIPYQQSCNLVETRN